MKKILPSNRFFLVRDVLLVLAMLLIGVHFSYGQLSGTVRIGTSGAAQYDSFNEVIERLTAQGLSGSLTILVEEGTYQEQVEFIGDNIANSSDFAIEIRGLNEELGSTTLTFDGNTADRNHTIDFEDIDNITISNLTIANTTPSELTRVADIEDAKNITITNCRLIGMPTAIADENADVITISENSDNFTITNSEIISGSIGISVSQSDRCVINDNTITDQFIGGIRSQIVDSLAVGRNLITASAETTDDLYSGIFLIFNSDFVLSQNRLILAAGTSALWLQSPDLDQLEQNLVVNNHIYVGSAGATDGVSFITARDIDFVHNTVAIDSGGVVLNLGGLSSSRFFNNNLINQSGDIFQGSASSVSASAIASDFNNMYSPIGIREDDLTLAQHTATTGGLDVNSIFYDVFFLDPQFPDVCHYALKGSGLALDIPVGEDFYGTARDVAAPDMGAFAFELPSTPIFENDSLQICLGDSIGLAAINVFESYLWLTDSSDAPVFVAKEQANYALEVVDQEGCTLVDTTFVETQFIEVDLGEDQVICQGASLVLNAPEGFASYLWSNGVTTDSLEVTAPSDYAIVVTNELGCTASDTVVVGLADDVIVPNFLVSGISCTSDTIKFVEVSDLEPDAVFWDFGDGNQSEEQHPTHLYGGVGDYEVTMTATLGECRVDVQKDIVITTTCPDFLVAYYPLDTGANDISDNGFDGAIQGGVGFVSDEERGMVAALNGVDGLIELSTTGAFDLVNSSFTISAWVKANDLIGNQPLLGTTSNQTDQGLELGYVDNNAFMSFTENDLSSRQAVAEGEWHFLTYVYDLETRHMKIYIDGELDAIDNDRDSFRGLDVVTIGRSQVDLYFSGLVDDLRIWKNPLTDEEIYEHFSGYSTQMLAHYELTENANDISGNDWNGAVSGNVNFINDDERGATATFGATQEDFIRIGPADEVGITERSFVVSAWIKINEFDKNNLSILSSERQNGSQRGLHLITRGRNPHMGFWGSGVRDETTLLDPNRWYHISYIYDRVARTQAIRVNGQTTVIGEEREPFLGVEDLIIGNGINFNWGFNGAIQDLKIRLIEDEIPTGRFIEEIQEIQELAQMTVYPNPSYGPITIELSEQDPWEGVLTIYTLRGDLIYNSNLSGQAGESITFDMSHVPGGLYILRLATANDTYVEKLIIRY